MGFLNRRGKLTDPGTQEPAWAPPEWTASASSVPLVDFWVRTYPADNRSAVTTVETKQLIGFSKASHLLAFIASSLLRLKAKMIVDTGVSVGTYAMMVQWRLSDNLAQNTQRANTIANMIISLLCQRLSIQQPQVYHLKSGEAEGYRSYHRLPKNKWYQLPPR